LDADSLVILLTSNTMAAAAHPVRTLRELVTSLEAAMTVTLASPKPKAVHRLRTTTRRIEAQFELFALLPNLPNHAKPAKKARKLLRKIRRAAGRVRDLDVQRDLTSSRSNEANQLRDLFKQQRNEAAKSLLDAIDRYQLKLARSLESLLEILAAAEPLAIPVDQIAQLTLHWYAHNSPASAKQSQRQLHGIRKAAKLARYIAESAAPMTPSGAKQRSTPAHRLALAFESLQQSGGDWHDWLTLSGIAHRELSAASPLTQSFKRRCEKSLADYQRHLKSLPRKIPDLRPPTVDSHPAA
jgi:CHAD domain-containing protein